MWDGPIIIKGIQTVDDATLAADGRHRRHLAVQPRRPPARLGSRHRSTWWPRWPTPSGGRIEIICDGGVRRGSDIVKAVALGATACTIGRAYLYGLGAGGERGVDHVLGLFDADVRRTMALSAPASVRVSSTWTDRKRNHVIAPPTPRRRIRP